MTSIIRLAALFLIVVPLCWSFPGVTAAFAQANPSPPPPEPIGFGISVQREAGSKMGLAHVVAVEAGSDADRAGIQPGDVITGMDMPTPQTGEHPQATLHLRHEGESSPIAISLQDSKVNLPRIPKPEMQTFGGIGMLMKDDGDKVVVAFVQDGSPAVKAGIKIGDVIVAVDGKSLSENGLKADNVIGLVRGKPGTNVVLRLLHLPDTKQFDVSIQRISISVPKPRPSTPVQNFAQAVPAIPVPVSYNISNPLPGVGELNAFSFGLFDRVLAGSPSANVVLSPFSADLALSMVANGAEGPTQAAMLKALQVTGSVNALNKSNQAIVAQLRMPASGTQLSVANSLWSLGSLKPSFLALDNEVYGAKLGDLRGAPANINEWVSSQTDGKIRDLIHPEDITDQTVAILVNAVYFKGRWVTQFDKSLTREARFNLTNGGSKQCQMMRHASHDAEMYYYYKGDGFEMARLGYGEGREIGAERVAQAFSMILILPTSGFMSRPMLLDGLANTIAAQGWQSWMALMKPTYGTISMPRLHSIYRTRLNDPLSALGMGIAFGDTADFSPMSADLLKIQHVIQQTYLDVDEEGTTAAAVTQAGMEMRGDFAPPPAEFDMVLDHPFLAVIVDNRSGAIVFLAAINDPG